MKKQISAKFLTITIAAIFILGAFTTAFAQDKIKYNAVYDCGKGKVKIKVLSCDGQSGDAECQVLFINKYSPGGGSIQKLERSYVQDNFVRQCKVEGGNADQEKQLAEDKADKKDQPENENQTADNKTTVEQNENNTASCQPSDDAGGNTQTDIFKRLIIARYEHQPEGSRDKTTTVYFQSFKSGATHKWRPGQGGESPDGPGGNFGTTIYPVKALYTVCSDFPGYKPTGYRGEVQKQQNDNTFYCFKNQVGEWQCNLGEGKNGEIKFLPK